MSFTPRLSTSSPTEMLNNPWWYSNGNTYYSYGAGLPNCTCYCFGRAAEIDGAFNYGLPQYNNGGEWFDWVVNNQTLPTGQTPALGAIACWYDPNGIYLGHVATVEEIDPGTGMVAFSNSGYPSNYFWISHVDSSTGYREPWMISRGYQLKGFIYLPPYVPMNRALWLSMFTEDDDLLEKVRKELC